FYYCICQPLFHTTPSYRLIWLVVASVLIAAGGYIINDYFDLNIDRVNKPGKNVLERIIYRRWAIIWHLVLSFAGLLATAIAVGLHKWYLLIANMFCVLLLWFYSTSFKRQLLIGNVIISLLTSWTILIVFFNFTDPQSAFSVNNPATVKFFRIAFLYAGFAFVISVIREAIKDIEDMEGDARYNCKTMPIVLGVRSTKIYIAVWLVVLIACLIVLQLYVLQFGWWPAVLYSSIMVIVPLLYTFLKLRKAQSAKEFTALSSMTKMIMLTGILSMIFFRIYF
ncbi:MAG TPA: geranylgeranylglycerol-phosphate geranylgeranyltransferase, partial [Flavisolibacter sp.]|nr:geranylgeranylglycerol-phosphate geranylgeranyltransferase [Flavisolibacter sp.]